MLSKVFARVSKSIAKEYKSFIESCINCGIKDINDIYYMYTSLDQFYPRPILTLLGIYYEENLLENIPNSNFGKIIYIPQMIRDFLAIHDDVIDEDLIKFSTDTLPYAITKLEESEKHSLNMSKGGKDRAILFADYLLPVIYNTICSVNGCDDSTKVKMIMAINQVMEKTNIGQLMELDLERKCISDIDGNEIMLLYKYKAADYCYAFPIEIGLIFANAPQENITAIREVLLNIGACSQIVNDMEGIFYENYEGERDTISDLLELRRTYLLVKFAKINKDKDVEQILKKKNMTREEAQIVKKAMLKSDLLDCIYDDILRICTEIKEQIIKLPVGDVLKRYINDLIDARVLENVKSLLANRLFISE